MASTRKDHPGETVPDGPDGSHPLDHWWLTAPWRIDGLPPIVRLARYSPGGRRATVQGVKPEGGLFVKHRILVENLKWCGAHREGA
jgi:hypothetical protein